MLEALLHPWTVLCVFTAAVGFAVVALVAVVRGIRRSIGWLLMDHMDAAGLSEGQTSPVSPRPVPPTLAELTAQLEATGVSEAVVRSVYSAVEPAVRQQFVRQIEELNATVSKLKRKLRSREGMPKELRELEEIFKAREESIQSMREVSVSSPPGTATAHSSPGSLDRTETSLASLVSPPGLGLAASLSMTSDPGMAGGASGGPAISHSPLLPAGGSTPPDAVHPIAAIDESASGRESRDRVSPLPVFAQQTARSRRSSSATISREHLAPLVEEPGRQTRASSSTIPLQRVGSSDSADANAYQEAVWGWGVLPGRTHPVPHVVPVLDVAGRPMRQVAVGLDVVLFLSMSGDVYQWQRKAKGDSNQSSRAIIGSPIEDLGDASCPRLIGALMRDKALRGTRIVSVCAGGSHCMALTEAGKVFTWGQGEDGRLGHGDDADILEPRPVMKLFDHKPVTMIAAGGAHSAAVTSDGAMFTWGRGRDGRLGHGMESPEFYPRRVSGLRTESIVAVDLGRSFSVAVSSDGNVWCWGRAAEGQCGPISTGGGQPAMVSTPRLLEGTVGQQRPTDIVAVACGHSHSLAISRAGKVYAWGSNLRMQLGCGRQDSHGPYLVNVQAVLPEADANDKVVMVRAGLFHSVAVSASGDLVVWGSAVLGADISPLTLVRLPQELNGVADVGAGINMTLIIEHPPVDTAVLSPASDEAAELLRPRRASDFVKAAERRNLVNKKKWEEQFLPNWEEQRSKPAMLAAWRQGIPDSIRGEVWPLAIGNKLKIHPRLFQLYCDRATRQLGSGSGNGQAIIGNELTMKLLDTDLGRTFPESKLFDEEGPLYDRLRKVLEAYSCYRPDVGYIQGMSYVAAMLCVHIEDSFLVFQSLCNLMVYEHLFDFFYDITEATLNQYWDVFDLMLAEHDSRAHKHLRKVMGTLSMTYYAFLFKWFQSMFVRCLPLHCAARVWDCFLLDGVVYLYRVAVAIVSVETRFFRDDSPDETVKILTNPQEYPEVWAILSQEDVLFKHIDAVSISDSVVARLRRIVDNAFFYRAPVKDTDPKMSVVRTLKLLNRV